MRSSTSPRVPAPPEFHHSVAVPYDPHMSLAVIWHYWIGLVFFFLAILVVIGTIVGYFVRVESLKYPKTPRR